MIDKITNAYHKDKLDETRQLTRPPGYYLTDLEGSKCEILDHADINFTPFKHQNIGAKYREICEGVDNGER